jgi:hypothetical protein
MHFYKCSFSVFQYNSIHLITYISKINFLKRGSPQAYITPEGDAIYLPLKFTLPIFMNFLISNLKVKKPPQCSKVNEENCITLKKVHINKKINEC